MARTPISVQWEFVIPDVPPDVAWESVADTDSLNRISGLPALAKTEVIEAPYGNTLFRMRTGFPVRMDWEERPFEFVRPRRHQVRRVYRSGPLVDFEGGAELFPEGSGTRVRFFARYLPRFALLGPLLRSVSMKRFRQAGELIRDRAARSAGGGAPVFELPKAPVVSGGSERLAAGIARIRQVTPEVAPKIEKLLAEGSDAEVLRIRPFELADRWQLPRLDVLRAFLHAASAQLVDLSWDILCPHCRMPGVRGQSLDKLVGDAACPVCDLAFETDFDATVEVTFSVSAAIRKVEPVLFCMGSPAKRRSVSLQQVVGAGEKRTVTLPLREGEYVAYRSDVDKSFPIQVGVGPSSAAIALDETGVSAAGGAPKIQVGAGEVTLTIENRLAKPARVSVAFAANAPDAVSASMVTSLQEFRELFSTEVLAPGVQMSVASLTLLFTDLKGSTALYERHGDQKVFPRVREHFDVLTAAVRAEGGGVVKTIGDAVMAAFPDPAAAVRAAIIMQRRMDALNRSQAGKGLPPLVVKVGLHRGSCLAMTANEKLDYFGNSVNTAARIEGQSHGGDVVITEAVAEDPEVRRILADASLRVTRFQAALKGLSGTASLVRLELVEGARAAGSG